MSEPELSDTELVEGYAPLTVDRDTAGYYRGWLARELRPNRCVDCGHWHHPPRPMCPVCWSWNVEPTAVSGKGTIHLLILLHQGPPAPGIDYTAGPYPVATVELEEQPGLRITSTIVGTPPHELSVGQSVELIWIERNGLPFPAFRRTEGGGS